MPEVGLVHLARVTMRVVEDVLPAHRSKFSKRVFTQPQLFAVLCLMRYEDWTFREAEVRLAEHSDLRAALELASVPDHTTLYRFMRRIDDTTRDAVLTEAAKRLPKRRGRPAKSTVAVDATGLAAGAISVPGQTALSKVGSVEHQIQREGGDHL